MIMQKGLRIKDIFQVFSGATPSSDVERFWDGDIVWVTPADMTDFGYIETGSNNITLEGYNSCGTHYVPEGSIIISSRAPIGKINIVKRVMCTNQGCKSLVPHKKNVNTKYIAYCLYDKVIFINSLGQGTTFNELPLKSLVSLNLTLPSDEYQQRAVNYLDEKLFSINNRIEVLEKQKDAYSRLKKSIIHQAVTRGLNPDVSLIHSGIDSIGMIPKHWEMKRLKDVVSINTKTLPEDTPNSYTFKYIDISNVTNEGVILGGETMSFYEAPSRARRIIERNDVIVSTVRTYLRAIARIDFSTEDIVVSTGFAVLTPNKGMNSVFITYGVRDVNIVDEICKRSTGVSYPAISASRLSAISIPVPPSAEQKDIAAYLDENCTKIDAIIDNISKQIDASKRLKKALINEVITGQRTI